MTNDNITRMIPEGDHTYEIVPGRDGENLLFTVFCVSALNRRIRCGDVSAHCKAPDRAVSVSFTLPPDAVSYTHLDVYKRQLLIYLVPLVLVAVSSFADVYKRQG